MNRDTGGQAYPQHNSITGHVNGMTLLDHFAGQALAGILAGAYSSHESFVARTKDTKGKSLYDHITRDAYGYAQAMIAKKRKLENEG